ncbi:hypothetical protein [Streptomyces sp. NPDC002676]
MTPFGTAFGALFSPDTFQGQQIERATYGDGDAVKKFVWSQPGLRSVSHFLAVINNKRLDHGPMTNEVGWFSKARDSWPATPASTAAASSTTYATAGQAWTR